MVFLVQSDVRQVHPRTFGKPRFRLFTQCEGQLRLHQENYRRLRIITAQPATEFLPGRLQQHQFFPAIDLNLSPKWEINFGVGAGVTSSTDHLISKMILGYRFDF